MRLRSSVRFHSQHNGLKGDRCRRAGFGALQPIPHPENFENVEPSAQFSDGDASDRLSRGDAGAAQNLEAGKSRCPDVFGDLHRLPQGGRGVFLKTVPRRIVARLPAPALYHLQRDGLAAQRLSDCQRRDRYPRFQADAGQQAKDAKPAHPSSSTVSAVRYARRRRPRPPGPKPSRNRPRSLPAPTAASQRPSRS